MTLPIRTRLTAIYGWVFCLGALALEIGSYTALNLAVTAIADRELQVRLQGIEEFLSDHLPRLSLERVQHEIKTHSALEPGLLTIRRVAGGSVFEAPSLAPFAQGAETATERAWTAGRSQQPLRLIVVRRTIKGIPYQLWLAADLTIPFEIMHRFGLLLLLSSPIIIAAAVVAGHWMAGRALAPVMAIATAARTIDATDLGRRIPLPPNRDELRYLAETLNGMLARMENSFRKIIEFTANASHELRTPLAVIRATAEVALLRPPGTDAHPDRVALGQILVEAERNTALLEGLLRLARADSGAAQLRMASIDLADRLKTICHRFQPLAETRRIELRAASSTGAVWVRADADYLKCLLRILIDNAIKYTPEGGRVEVSLVLTSPHFVACQIQDTGIGISEVDLPHIFERFFRSDRARNREKGGSGLGLAIAEWIAGAHNGRIEVESTVGAGSTFRLVIPRLVHSGEPDSEPAEYQPSMQGSST